MKKPSSKIREEIAKLQEQLKQAETREAERIGRIALKAGLGEIDPETVITPSIFVSRIVKVPRTATGPAGFKA